MKKDYKEIGGYFEFETLINNEYHVNALRFSSARNCLRYIIKKRDIKKIYIPIFLCDVVRESCKKDNVQIEYYSVDANFHPILDNIDWGGYVYIVNYFGLLSNKTLQDFSNKYKNIIIDNTHAFFQKNIKNADTIYNCRKYFGVPDGAYLYTKLKLDNNIDTGLSQDRFEHLIGRYENNASDYYKSFSLADETFKNEQILRMSKITKNILGAIDYKKVKALRQDNFRYLEKNLKTLNKLNLHNHKCNYMYPLYISNGRSLREYLIKHKVYVPLLWHNVLKDIQKDSIEYNFANDIVHLPIDQRYTIEDMKKIVDLINIFIEENHL